MPDGRTPGGRMGGTGMARGAMAFAVPGHGQVLACRPCVVQGVRCVQCCCAIRAYSKPCQNQPKCQYARASHPASILSTMDYVPCVFPRTNALLAYWCLRGMHAAQPRILRFPTTAPALQGNCHHPAGTPFMAEQSIAYSYDNRPVGDDPPQCDRLRAFWGDLVQYRAKFRIETTLLTPDSARPPTLGNPTCQV